MQLGDVSRIHFSGGSFLGSSRANPTTKDEDLVMVVESLHRLGVTQLITIGGDDTAFSAMKVSEKAAGKLRVVHVPKTIDNDLDLDPVGRFLRLPDRPPPRRRAGQEPDGRRQDHLALVLRGGHGAQGRPPGARHRQGGRRDPDRHPRGVPAPQADPAHPGRHPGRRHHQAPGRGPALRRGGAGRGPGRGLARGGHQTPGQHRARRARPHPRLPSSTSATA